MPIPQDYPARVYAGVLGKIIGVYLGRPIEGWSHERITAEFGEVDRYLPGRDGAPLVVTDDDISGTFTFLRALPDNGNPRDITPQQIAEAWLNYTIEGRTIFWWGGDGVSTEHTAYLNLKRGVPAPESGSIARNGKIIAEQIGSQIFIDGWGMVAPGDPELAADLAKRAASVSHDGEAIYGAQIVAAMEAAAFVASDLEALLDTGLRFIPNDSVIARLIQELRDLRRREPDWRVARDWIAANYGYDRYRGACHMVPNHALIIHALLYGDDDFGRSLMIVNTSGWDTDCNSGNVGCLLGIKNGLATLDGGYDWRGPVADRLYLSTAEGGRGISDAAIETFEIVNIGRALAGLEPLWPKTGARFHFELPGSVQGFESTDPGQLESVEGHSLTGARALKVTIPGQAVQVTTPTFIPLEAIKMPGYELFASPTLYSGQTVRARVTADAANRSDVQCTFVMDSYGCGDSPDEWRDEPISLSPGESRERTWDVPDTDGAPIFSIGLLLESRLPGAAYLDYLTWDGTPSITLKRDSGDGNLWQRAWVAGVDRFESDESGPFRIVQNEGVGLISQGTADWKNYQASAPVTIRGTRSGGLAIRVQGLRRYYALLLCDDGFVRLVKAKNGIRVLAESSFAGDPDIAYTLVLEASSTRLRAWINGDLLFDLVEDDSPLLHGSVGLVVENGTLSAESVTVRPASR